MSDFNHNRGVCVGHRGYKPIIDDNEFLEELLKSDLRLRRSNDPIKCSMILNTVYDEGDSSHWMPHEAIIHLAGLTKRVMSKKYGLRVGL